MNPPTLVVGRMSMSPKPVQHQLRAQAGEGSCHTAGCHQKGQVKQHSLSGDCHCHQHLAGVVEDGVEAKYAINDGLVLVNGEVENRRGRKIHPGDTISYDGKDIYVIG